MGEVRARLAAQIKAWAASQNRGFGAIVRPKEEPTPCSRK